MRGCCRYLGDSQIMSVMGKLRKLQGIFRTNGKGKGVTGRYDRLC